MMCKVFTYGATVIILSIGALIFVVGMLGSLFFSGVSILFVGLSISFGNRVKNLSEKYIEIDRKNKEVNDGSGR